MASLFRHTPAVGLRLLILILLSISLMVLDHRGRQFAGIRAALSTFVLPIQYLIDRPATMINTLASTIVRQEALRKENAHLRAMQIMLRAQLQKFSVLKEENSQLRTLLQSTPKISGTVKVAQLLAVDSTLTTHQIVLDMGSRQNVYEGQPVLDASGVIGQVLYAGPLTSHVLLITDRRSAIPVTVERTGMHAIVEGTGSLDKLALINLSKTADIKISDTLVTSGLDQKFPEGYPVGTVSLITYSPDKDFAEIAVTPTALLHRMRLVLLFWPPSPDIL